MMTDRRAAIGGCLLGTAVGDALGLPYEGLSARRAARMLGPPDRHRLVAGRGLLSDDTEHAAMVARAFIESGGDPERFEKRLARGLRRWLLALPAGVGWATLRSIVKLWLGFGPARSGVFSAGNGPAMRSPLLGVVLGDDPRQLKDHVHRCTRVTHTDPKADHGALAVAAAAHLSFRARAVTPDGYLALLNDLLDPHPAGSFPDLMARAAKSAAAGQSTAAFASAIGCRGGISGYVLHTVPCVVQTWLRHPDDFAGGVVEIVSAGGDADTTAAILGAIIGTRVGRNGIPTAWVDGLADWPRSVGWLEKLAAATHAAASGHGPGRAPGTGGPLIVLRNLVFLVIVLTHGLRRLLPPY